MTPKPKSTHPGSGSNPQLLKLVKVVAHDLGETPDEMVWFWGMIRRRVGHDLLPDLKSVAEAGPGLEALEGEAYVTLRHMLYDLVKAHPDNRRMVGYCLSLWSELGVVAEKGIHLGDQKIPSIP